MVEVLEAQMTKNEKMLRPPLPLGTSTKWGRIEAVCWKGERYYMILNFQGDVALMPANVVEPKAKEAK